MEHRDINPEISEFPAKIYFTLLCWDQAREATRSATHPFGQQGRAEPSSLRPARAPSAPQTPGHSLGAVLPSCRALQAAAPLQRWPQGPGFMRLHGAALCSVSIPAPGDSETARRNGNKAGPYGENLAPEYPTVRYLGLLCTLEQVSAVVFVNLIKVPLPLTGNFQNDSSEKPCKPPRL